MWILCSRNYVAEFLLAGGAVISVRKATSEDMSGILACLSAALAEYRDSYTSGAFADTVLTAETIARRLQEMTTFVAIEQSGHIVGTVACGVVGPDEGRIRRMAVLPAWQGTGVAARLLLRAESHFREANCKGMTLDKTAPLRRAMRLDERFGFSPSGRIASFSASPPITWHSIPHRLRSVTSLNLRRSNRSLRVSDTNCRTAPVIMPCANGSLP
jgi:GNAT superfamily N-acetyltransferase